MGPDEITVSASMYRPAVFVAWWIDTNVVNRVHWPGVPLTKAEKLHYLSRVDLSQDVFHLTISPPNNSNVFGPDDLTGSRVTRCARQYGVVVIPAGTVSPDDC